MKIIIQYKYNKERLRAKSDFKILESEDLDFDSVKSKFEKQLTSKERDYFDVHIEECEQKVLVLERLDNGKINRIGFYSKIHAKYPMNNWTNPISFKKYSWDYNSVERGDSNDKTALLSDEY